MSDFIKEQETLENYIAETGPMLKWLQELQAFFVSKELSNAEEAEASTVPDVIRTYGEQLALAKTLLDAIAYYRRESVKVRDERNRVWFEIAYLKAEENDLKSRLGAFIDNLKTSDGQLDSATRKDLPDDIAYDFPTNPETLGTLEKNGSAKKRRRSFARKVVDKSKEVIDSIRSRSNSRSRQVLG